MIPKLVLFDIDGTLIHNLKPRTLTFNRWHQAAKDVYGVDIEFVPEKYDGWVDRQIAWDLLAPKGVSRKVYEDKLPEFSRQMAKFLVSYEKDGPMYEVFSEAKTLVERLQAKGIPLGVLSGNTTDVGLWKLRYNKLDSYFPFYLFGEEAETRIDLAKSVFAKAKSQLGLTLTGKEIVVIGDTVNDVRCGRAIGAATIGVLTGKRQAAVSLTAEKPDILVKTLMDKPVLDFFQIQL